MPRFPNGWTPESDSTPGVVEPGVDRIVLSVPHPLGGRSACPCGCGEWPLGDNAVFRMGHDARLRGKLIRAHLTGTKVQLISGNGMEDAHLWDAADLATRHGWEGYLQEASLRREGKNREVLRRALEAGDKLVRVGRWAFTRGQVAAIYKTGDPEKHLLEYVNVWGERKTMRIPANEEIEVMD